MQINQIIEFIREHYRTNDFIPLHAPIFGEFEKAMVVDTIKSTFVSSVGQYVDKFEKEFADFVNNKNAVAVVNGTAALHSGLVSLGVADGDMVITQALTFVATCNAIKQAGADPIFCDVSNETLGLCPIATEEYLTDFAEMRSNNCFHKQTGRPIKAILVMHTFGHPVHLREFRKLCSDWNLHLIEDCAESLGSFYEDVHTGNFGKLGTFSFNGNKIITTGGGGMISTNFDNIAVKLKHLTTTAKVPHTYEFIHDEQGFNYRLPNLNAALGCAQMTRLNSFIKEKRSLAEKYRLFFKGSNYEFFTEPSFAKSNYWLNAVRCENSKSRNELLEITNNSNVMTRPAWRPMHKLIMYQDCACGDLSVTNECAETIVNLPSWPFNDI